MSLKYIYLDYIYLDSINVFDLYLCLLNIFQPLQYQNIFWPSNIRKYILTFKTSKYILAFSYSKIYLNIFLLLHILKYIFPFNIQIHFNL